VTVLNNMTARASMDHVTSLCAGSIRLYADGVVSRDEEGDPKDIGHQAHDAFSSMVQVGDIDVDALPEPVRVLYFCARKVWEEIREFFSGDVFAECRLDVGPLTGTADLICFNPQFNWLLVLDWKTGRVERNHKPQLLGYAGRWLAINKKWPAKIFLYSVDVRSMAYTVEEATPDEAMRHIHAITSNVAVAETHGADDIAIFNRGAHCQFCPCSERCPAVVEDLSRFYEISTQQTIDLASMSDDQIAEAYTRKKLMDRVLDAFDDALKAEVAARGAIALGDGRELVFSESTVRSYDPIKTAEHVREIASTAEILKCFKVAATDLKDLIKSKAPKGKKAAFEKEWLEKLERWGACAVTTTRKLTAKKIAETQAQITEENA
jgi:hypothetical protein